MSRYEGLTRWLRRAAWPADRRGWGTLALVIVLLVHGYRYVSFNTKESNAYSDGFYTWIFARSLAFDGDLDLTNDYALCGDPFHLGNDEGGGRPADPFYFGPALVFTPVLWVLKTAIPLRNVRAEWRNGCTGPLVRFTGAISIFAVALTVWLAYRVARRWFAEGPSALAMVVMALASPLDVTGTLAWHYSHLWAALAVAVVLLCIVRARERPELWWRWVFVGLAGGLAALMRMQEALWMVLALVVILQDRTSWWRVLERCSLVGITFCVAFSLQLYVFQKLYGWPFILPQGKLYVQLGHAHPWLLLFSARSGLLYWTPLMWLSILGLPWFLRRSDRRPFAIGVVLVSCALFYLASATLAWTGSGTLGARVQTSLVPAMLLPAAAFLEVTERRLRRWRFGARAAILLAIVPWILIGWNAPLNGVRNDAPVPAPTLYGGGVTYSIKQVYEAIGNPATLPAGTGFWLRYRAPPSVFDRLATEGIFARSYRTDDPINTDMLNFARPPSEYWSEDVRFVKGGSSATAIGLEASARGRFLITLFWPWTTSIKVRAVPISGRPTTLTIRTRSPYLITHDVGTLTFRADETLELPVGRGDFDSGINEVLLVADGPIELIRFQWLDAGKHDRSLRLFK